MTGESNYSIAISTLGDWLKKTRDSLERFSIYRCKTNKSNFFFVNEPIHILGKFVELAQSAGKIARASCDWFWFSLSLAEKVA